MNIKYSIKKLLIPMLALIIGISVGSFGFISANGYRNQSLAPAPQYPRNESGETYGSALNAISPETEPDLIKAYGTDGTIGYVRSTDLKGIKPKTPKEALAQQEKENKDKEIPLYDKDGKKVIGKFKISGSSPIEDIKK